MTVTIAIDSKFKHLNADRSYAVKVGGVGVEKEIICNITIIDEDLSDAVIGEFIADFTQIGLKQVYSAEIVAQDNFVSTFDTTRNIRCSFSKIPCYRPCRWSSKR